MSRASNFVEVLIDAKLDGLEKPLANPKVRQIVGNLYKGTVGNQFCSERELARALHMLALSGKAFSRVNTEDAVLKIRSNSTYGRGARYSSSRRK